uniref:30S ribosomal protein S21 n=1 Tax=Phaeomonas parva TaxID=124430 RepID=A0A7S1XR96_9STRA|mmetsp:Transcript_31725/g.100796  ORF Transcript_31725/g.100796 Transcript_31725/m.100796 type:complete len:101 (+) Transcript_31725:209-511(+)
METLTLARAEDLTRTHPLFLLLQSSSALNVVKINVGEEEPIDDALKRFKRSVLRSGHMQLLRRRRTFEKNPEKKKREQGEKERRGRIMRLKNQKYKVHYK